MALIDGTGDYETDIGSRVADSETQWAEDQDELPAISVFDGDALATATSPAASAATIHTMPVLIRGFLKQGTTASAARKLLKDIKRAVRVDDKWGGLVMQTREAREAIVRNPDNFQVEACEVEIETQFKTDKFDAE